MNKIYLKYIYLKYAIIQSQAKMFENTDIELARIDAVLNIFI